MGDTGAKIDLTSKDKAELLERFLRYVAVNTRSDEESEDFPSTPVQWDLLKLLEGEMKEVGLTDVELDDKGYLFGTLPSNLPNGANIPVIGYLAHVDTYGGTSGENVKPNVIETYDGSDIALTGAGAVLDVASNPLLKECVGHTVITTDGTTLLGADDKAGVAAIMTIVDWFVKHPEIPHGELRVGFTPDEETGNGTRFFDVERFNAYCAYTFDGSLLGEIENETFSGDSASVEITGYDTHPGMAKDVLINALRVAAHFLQNLPEGFLPETTEKRQSYVHPMVIKGDVASVTINFIVRAFNVEELHEREKDLKRVAGETQTAFPGSKVEVKISESYRNMKEILDKHPKVVEYAMEAVRRSGVKPVLTYIRGGTDGSQLSFKGLPCPNIFAGGVNFHGTKEWASLDWMLKSVETGINLAVLWGENRL